MSAFGLATSTSNGNGANRARSATAPYVFSSIPGFDTFIQMVSFASHAPSSSSSSATPALSVQSSSPKAPLPSNPSAPPFPTSPPRKPNARNNHARLKRNHKRKTAQALAEADASRAQKRLALSFRKALVGNHGAITDKATLKHFSAPRLAHSIGAWIGLHALDAFKLAGWTVTQLIIWQCFSLIEWDGRCVYFGGWMTASVTDPALLRSKSFALVDEDDSILARCIERPEGWEELNDNVCAAMDKAQATMGTPQRSEDGRRGFFPTIFTGFSYGGGQDVRPFSPSSFSAANYFYCRNRRSST